jgi:hypothetical protein
MTLPAALWMHTHVSERELAHTWPDGQLDDARWEDCVWCSFVEWLNDTYRDVPDTLAYAEKWRDASGLSPTGGSTFANVQTALNKFGINITLEPRYYTYFMPRLKPGYAGVAMGDMGNFPAGHRLRRWSPDFTGIHAVYIARLPDGRLWWCDPLAPAGTYQGETVTEAEVKTYMGSTWMGVARPLRVKAPEPTPVTTEAPMALLAYLPGYVASLLGGKNVRNAPGPITDATKVRVTAAAGEKVNVVGTVAGTVPVGLLSNVWYLWYEGGKPVYIHSSNVTSAVKPVTDDGYTKLTQDAAVAAQKTADAALLTSSVAKATLDAKAAEKARIADAEKNRILAL